MSNARLLILMLSISFVYSLGKCLSSPGLKALQQEALDHQPCLTQGETEVQPWK